MGVQKFSVMDPTASSQIQYGKRTILILFLQLDQGQDLLQKNLIIKIIKICNSLIFWINLKKKRVKKKIYLASCYCYWRWCSWNNFNIILF